MKVTGVKTYVIENESAPRSGGGEETGNWYVGGKYFLILELSTDEGIIGLGEKLTGSSFTGYMTWKEFRSLIGGYLKFNSKVSTLSDFDATEKIDG